MGAEYIFTLAVIVGDPRIVYILQSALTPAGNDNAFHIDLPQLCFK